ncbi:arginine--tRNA ligase [Candidatus Saccharibacteria bacterium]|nr:arginine--tRNA ligase [Candidatus Saccharibacteria bacterium]
MQEIREVLKGVIKELYGIDFEPEVTVAPENIEADYSSNIALKIAKVVRKSPMEIAESLATLISVTGSRRLGPSTKVVRQSSSQRNEQVRFPLDSSGGLPRARRANPRAAALRNPPLSDISITKPGFINFIVSDEYLSDELGIASNNLGAYIENREYKEQTIVCEFSDPNPFKVLHVGHLYTSVVGDAIARLFEYAGADVIRANFGGDVGLHVAKTMYVLRQKDVSELKIEDIAKCYIEGTALYEEDEKAHAEITELNKEIYKINAEDMHGTELADLYWRARELSYEYFKEFYARIGVKFDKYYPESTVAGLGLEIVKEQLEKGVYEESEGAVVFDGDKYGLHTRVFINKEGVPTYETKDVGLIFTKWEDWHFDKSVVITGSEQLDYMRVVLKSVEQYAPELTERTVHLTHGLVKLPGGVKMSSRKGNFLKAVEVLEMVSVELKEQYDSEDEKVALAAIKYAFLKYKMGGNIVFDPKESVKMTGNSGPYLLYSCVRAKKVLGKIEEQTFVSGSRANPRAAALRNSPITNVCSSYERSLMIKLIEYKDVLKEAVSEMAPHRVAGYLYELAQEFSRFYEKCPVVGDEREAERVRLVKAYLDTMTHGLKILGIEIPEEM